MKQQHRMALYRRVALLPYAALRNCRSYPSLRRSTSVQYRLDTIQSARQHNSVFKRELIMGMAVVGIVVRNNE